MNQKVKEWTLISNPNLPMREVISICKPLRVLTSDHLLRNRNGSMVQMLCSCQYRRLIHKLVHIGHYSSSISILWSRIKWYQFHLEGSKICLNLLNSQSKWVDYLLEDLYPIHPRSRRLSIRSTQSHLSQRPNHLFQHMGIIVRLRIDHRIVWRLNLWNMGRRWILRSMPVNHTSEEPLRLGCVYIERREMTTRMWQTWNRIRILSWQISTWNRSRKQEQDLCPDTKRRNR